MPAKRPRLPLAPESLNAEPKDDGLFGPGSVTWRLMAAPSTGPAIGAAVLMQMLLPGVIHMIAQSSSFKTDPETRGRLTAEYGATATYGDTAAAERAGELLRNIHRHRTAIDPETGAEYRADRPDLLLWVHTTIVFSILRACERWGPRLSPADRDRFVAEQRTAARLVGIDPTAAPGSVAELNAYYHRMLPKLAYTLDAADIVKGAFLKRVTESSWLKRSVGDSMIDLLPDELVELYGFKRSRWEKRTTAVVTRVVLGLAASKLPYEKVLPGLRRQATEHAFGGVQRPARSTTAADAARPTQ